MKLNNSQKYQYGFTLVELIITITILAVLATISFIAIQNYTKDARNAKRIDHLSKVGNTVLSKNISGISVMSFSNSGSEIPSIYIGGKPTLNGTDYQAGSLNYNTLGMKAVDFQDPLLNTSYKIGVSLGKKSVYEIASIMETPSSLQASVLGNWTPRSLNSINGIGNLGENSFRISDFSNINTFYKGDYVLGGGVSYEVIDISSDGLTITFDRDISASISSIGLEYAEPIGLIGSVDDVSIPVTNLSSNLPYR